ncbi:MgtC/SapB family protein [Ideonella sp. B7]|uniref:MgtC/SapB family protein n=1 Tax=Ideonella benzenivorans TaxID=2831643 RepID=UPI001CEDCAC7|nr:DUF4010 domain-containing protein [Ideonella benzenivorans]MCA6217896.1 MgtC/SapB family protein [Ideonella benzenivorans]
MSPTLEFPGMVQGLAAALGAGLLVGLERERRKGESRERNAAGIRTFSVASLLGALAQSLNVQLQQPSLVLLGGLMVMLLGVFSYLRSLQRDPGVTTELALFTTYVIGVLCAVAPLQGGGLAVVLAGLLASRTQLHRFSTRVLTEAELHDGLMLAAFSLVALPLIPPGPLAALGGLNLRQIALLVLLLLGMQAAGHVALRAFGERAGMVLTGVFGGVVSSTATIATMGAKARHGELPARAALTAAVASTVATWTQAELILLTQSPELAWHLAAPAALGTLMAAAGTLTLIWHATPDAGPAGPVAGARVLQLREALLVAGALAGVSWLVRAASQWLGPEAVVASASLSGMVDAHASAAALGGLYSSGDLDLATAKVGVVAVITANSVSRAVVAASAGGRQFALPVAATLLSSAAASWLGWWLTRAL